MNNVLKSTRLHIGILGKRNVGKSSLLNFVTSQNMSIVSSVAGTTTDPVEKAMELLPIGPVLFIDTAGIDDIGALGEQRVKKTISAIDRMDIAFVVVDYNGLDDFELGLIEELKKHKTPFLIVINKTDVQKISDSKLRQIMNITNNVIEISTKDEKYIAPLKQLIIKIMPEGFFDEEKIIDDLVQAGDTVIQVIPIDKQAPKGRLILPQVRTIRNALDNGVVSIITRENELDNVLKSQKYLPKLVITDSQAFAQVDKIVPKDIKLTSYSILFARLKGDLQVFVKGAEAIKHLQTGDKILIAESCSHHPACDDIGRVKIPNLLKKFTQKELIFEAFSGHDFPENLSEYALVIQCGGCMTNKKEILSRILAAKDSNVPITNYGIAIAFCLGILDRATEVFFERQI